jgi:hypothetical protein
LLNKFGNQSEHVNQLLTLIESNIPIDSIYGDLANDEKVTTQNDAEFAHIKMQFLSLLKQLCSIGSDRETTKNLLLEIEPYKTFHAQLSKEK